MRTLNTPPAILDAGQHAIVAALQDLAARWGVQSTALARRLGPVLLPLVGGAPGDSSSALRAGTIRLLDELTADYPAALRRTLYVALAVDADARFETLTKRQEVLAAEFSWSSRTVRRRIHEAFVRLAEDIGPRLRDSGRSEDPERGWRILELSTVVRLDSGSPELIEERTIQAGRAGLRVIAIRFSLPPPPDRAPNPAVVADVLWGARLIGQQQLGPARFRYLLELPDPLPAGGRHTYQMAFRVPPGQTIRPYYVFVPPVPCARFQLRVRFAPDRPPAAAWVIRHASASGTGPAVLTGEPIQLDGVSEVHQVFTEPALGFAYGVGWTFTPPATTGGACVACP